MSSSLQQPRSELEASELQLPASPSELGVAREFVERVAMAFGLDSEEAFDFGLAANEAVTNAIRHGSPDRRGRISVRAITEGNRLTLVVRDYGVFHEPRSGAQQRLDGGRGMDMMRSLTDDFELIADPIGTTVRLSKDRT